MGVVYEAWDDRLSRPVAIKTFIGAGDPAKRERFLREARAAAAVNHPHICQLFDIGEQDGEPFLCMELLDGKSLGQRLEEGPLGVQEATPIGLAILSALSALHRRGIVHRDLKPSNVFLAASGVKLVDFGLARTTSLQMDETAITMPGTVMGSPRYMAPEQVRGEDVDARADIFAAGLVLFEMLSGRAAFAGTSAIDVLHAVVHEHPPALMGSPAVVALDRIIQRAVAKLPADRYQSADEMATDVRACVSRTEATDVARARATRRLVVLPFKVLRPDPDVDFLAYSLPDAITVSLSALDSLTVRSSLAAARFAEGAPDLRVLASELGVDAAITGTLLHAGKTVRVAVQLIEVPSGTVRWSHSAQVSPNAGGPQRPIAKGGRDLGSHFLARSDVMLHRVERASRSSHTKYGEPSARHRARAARGTLQPCQEARHRNQTRIRPKHSDRRSSCQKRTQRSVPSRH
jgi:serine/threonine protein kinase